MGRFISKFLRLPPSYHRSPPLFLSYPSPPLRSYVPLTMRQIITFFIKHLGGFTSGLPYSWLQNKGLFLMYSIMCQYFLELQTGHSNGGCVFFRNKSKWQHLEIGELLIYGLFNVLSPVQITWRLMLWRSVSNEFKTIRKKAALKNFRRTIEEFSWDTVEY